MSQPVEGVTVKPDWPRRMEIETWLNNCEDILAREEELKRRLADIQREAQLKAEPVLFELGLIENRRPPKPIMLDNGMIATYCGPQHYDSLTLKRLKEQIGVQE